MTIHRPVMCQHFIKWPVLTIKITGKKFVQKKNIVNKFPFEAIIDYY